MLTIKNTYTSSRLVALLVITMLGIFSVVPVVRADDPLEAAIMEPYSHVLIEGTEPDTFGDADGTYSTTVNFNYDDDDGLAELATISITTGSDCHIWKVGPGGGDQGTTYSVEANPDGANPIVVIVVDDSEYEGDHSCLVTGTLDSLDPDTDGFVESISVTIKDNDPAPSSPSTPTTTSSSSPSSGSTDTSSPDVHKPVFGSLYLNNVEVTDSQAIFTFGDKTPLTISGTTVANGILKLHFSDSMPEPTVKADSNGEWSFNPAKLELGDYELRGEVTDPSTGQTSNRALLASFTLIEGSSPVVKPPTPPEPKNGSKENLVNSALSGKSFTIWAIILILILLAGAGVWFYRKHSGNRSKKSKSKTKSKYSFARLFRKK